MGAVRIDHTNPIAILDALPDQMFEEIGLAAAGGTDNVAML